MNNKSTTYKKTARKGTEQKNHPQQPQQTPTTKNSKPKVCKQGKNHRKPADKLRIIPLGGLDAIGKNMTAFVYKNDMILVDAGCMFPDESHPGIELILPDYSYIVKNQNKLRGIFVTHGHEDHTGALPYLLKSLNDDVDIYASKMTLGLVKAKLDERKQHANLKVMPLRKSMKIGSFEIEAFTVNHSIPGAMGFMLRTPEGNVLMTGDFKLDQTPIDGIRTDYEALTSYSKEGVDLLLADSTNANIPGFTPSEAEVGVNLSRIISEAKGRVIIACFASHVHRLQQIANAAKASGRKLVVTGRSMTKNLAIARKLGYLHIDDDDIVDAVKVDKTLGENIVVVCTGSQGEPLSALSRIARGEHRNVQAEAGDTIIFSSSPIPGNEKAVINVINQLVKLDCHVYSKKESLVHVSGHASAEELKMMLALVQPKNFMPVHGEAAHLKSHAVLAERIGIPTSSIIVCDNGETVELDSHRVHLGKPIESGVLFVEGHRVRRKVDELVSARKAMNDAGVMNLTLLVDRKTGMLSDIRVSPCGVVAVGQDKLASDVRASVFVKFSAERIEDTEKMSRECTSYVENLLWNKIKANPVVLIDTVLV